MWRYTWRRIFAMIPTLLIIVFVVFFILNLMPSSPGRIILGLQASQEQVDALNETLGYNRPVPVRFLKYVADMFRGDFGTSYTSGRPVADILVKKFPTTLKLSIISVALSSFLGITVGMISAIRSNTVLDRSLTISSLFFASVPTFWLGLIFMLIFSLTLHLLPSSGVSSWKSYVLPVLTLSLPEAAYLSRLTRASMLEAISQDYIRTANAKGAGEMRIMLIHAFRNALMPVITEIGMGFAWLLGGSVVVENVFGLPGIGQNLLAAINKKDVPVVMASVLMISLAFMLIMLIVDLLYALIDPRIKNQYRK